MVRSRQKEGREAKEKEREFYTSFKVHSADNQAFFFLGPPSGDRLLSQDHPFSPPSVRTVMYRFSP